jgi:hypothetical protein
MFNNHTMTSYIPSVKNHHLYVTQASFHVVRYHAHGSVNAWMWKTKDLRNVTPRSLIHMHHRICRVYQTSEEPAAFIFRAVRYICTSEQEKHAASIFRAVGTYLPTYSGSAQWLRAALPKGSTRLGAFLDWRRKHNRLPNCRASFKNTRCPKSKKRSFQWNNYACRIS